MKLTHEHLIHYSWHVFIILCIFVSSPMPPMCISDVGSFSVWSRCSLIFFSISSKWRELVLNFETCYMLGVVMVLCLGQVLDTGICGSCQYIQGLLATVGTSCGGHLRGHHTIKFLLTRSCYVIHIQLSGALVAAPARDHPCPHGKN